MADSLSTQEQDHLLHNLADTFHTDLFLVDGKVRGLVQDHPLNIGGIWNIKSDMTIYVDERGPKRVAALVRVMDHLWAMYIGTKNSTNLFFFDSDKAKIRVGAEKDFAMGKGEATFLKLRSAITSSFSRSADGRSEDRVWQPLVLTEEKHQCLFS